MLQAACDAEVYQAHHEPMGTHFQTLLSVLGIQG